MDLTEASDDECTIALRCTYYPVAIMDLTEASDDECTIALRCTYCAVVIRSLILT